MGALPPLLVLIRRKNMSIQYDPSVILDEAAQLYAHAERVEEQYRRNTAFGFLCIGFCVGGVPWAAASLSSDSGAPVGLIITGASALLGYIYGNHVGRRWAAGRGQELRREAQKLLCQVEIEKNTRARLPG